jgi:protein-ribulosamine 3-kinase
MADYAELLDHVGRRAGVDLLPDSSLAVAGGDISQAVRVTAANSRRYFLKLNAPQYAAMFAAEFAGLEELARAPGLRVPEPIAHGQCDPYSWLLLEWLELVPADAGVGARLGQAVAKMHRVTASDFGWTRNNTIGRTPQINTPTADWPEFFCERRLRFQLELAASNGLSSALCDLGYGLLDESHKWFGDYAPAASLLHGDLWGGNWGMLADGSPVLFDPAVYYGDREADIAMTRLFGGFDAQFYRAYVEAWPLDAGYESRQDLYNLYHVLNHYNLFGGHYLAQVQQMLQSLRYS